MEHLNKDEFLEQYPMFWNLPEAWVEKMVELAGNTFNRCLWGPWLQYAEGLWIAHQLAMRAKLNCAVGDGSGNPCEGSGDGSDPCDWLQGVYSSDITAFSAGTVSYTKGNAAAILENPLLSTRWGAEYAGLLTRFRHGLVMVT